MQQIKINNKTIGKESPCFIIAEAGVNHNGKLSLAKKLVDEAKNAGADAVKFQTFTAENVVTPDTESADYQVKNIGKKITQLEMIKTFELSFKDFIAIKKYCDKKEIMFLSTPHSFDAIDFLNDLVPAYKFGSGDITNLPSLIYAAKKNKPIILGTGMSNMYEVQTAIKSIESTGNKQIIALHCTTSYPCKFQDVNLNAMISMKKQLDCLIGYSDHTLGIIIPVMAIALGASVLEKHFTLDKNLPGPDHLASLEPVELKTMIQNIRNAEKAMGSYEKKPTESEIKIKDIVRKSLVSNCTIQKGDIIEKEKLTIKRPGFGIQPYDIEKILGKKVKKTIKKNSLIIWDDIQ